MEIETLFRTVFAEVQRQDQSDFVKKQDEFVFHMTDWIDDIHDLLRLYTIDATVEVAARQIVGFLAHVVPHVNAAGRLLMGDVPDPFAVGKSEPAKTE
jgi:hypothetical protein